MDSHQTDQPNNDRIFMEMKQFDSGAAPKPDVKTIWANMNDWLLAFVTAEVGDAHAARDIVQEVFIKVQLNLKKLKEEQKLTSWVFRIARNQINDHFRRLKRERGALTIKDTERSNSGSMGEDRTSISEGHPILDSENPDDMNSNFALCIRPMIELLPDKYRKAMELSEIQGMSQKALAQELGISWSGAKSRVQRGRQLLKEILLQCCEISTDSYGNIIEYKQHSCDEDCN